MKAELDCVYRGIKEIPEGSFINDKGEQIKYLKHYKINIDQIINGLPVETLFSISQEKALNCAKILTLYDKIVITFNIIINNRNKITYKIDNIRKL